MTIHKVSNKSGKILRSGLSAGKSIIVPIFDIIQTPQTSKLRKGLGKISTVNVSGYQFGITELLLHGENNFDDTFYPKTISNNNVTISSAQSKFGSNSFLFGNNTSQFLSISDNTFSNQFWFLGSSDFIIECFFYLNGLTFPQQLMGVWGGTYSWRITLNGASNFVFALFDAGGVTRVWGAGSETWAVNTWYHLAFSRKGNNCRSWVNGNLKSTINVSGFSVNRPTGNLEIGRNGDIAWPVNGYMDEIRIVRGYGVDTMTIPDNLYLP